MTASKVYRDWSTERHNLHDSCRSRPPNLPSITVSKPVLACVILLLVGHPAASEESLHRQLSQLFGDLGSPERFTRLKAAQALIGFGREAMEVVPALRWVATQDSDFEVRFMASAAMISVAGPESSAVVVPTLVLGIDYPFSYAIREASIQDLGKLGPLADAAVPRLVQALMQENDSEMQMSAAIALKKIGTRTELVLPAILKVLESGSAAGPTVVGVLESYGAEAVSAIPKLIGVLQQSSETPLLLSLLEALAAFQSASRKALPTIEPLLRHESEDVRVWAMYSMAKITGKADTHVSSLIKTLEKNDTPRSTRFNVLILLGKLGTIAEDSTSAVARIAQDETSSVELRELAEETLKKIEQGLSKSN